MELNFQCDLQLHETAWTLLVVALLLAKIDQNSWTKEELQESQSVVCILVWEQILMWLSPLAHRTLALAQIMAQIMAQLDFRYQPLVQLGLDRKSDFLNSWQSSSTYSSNIGGTSNFFSLYNPHSSSCVFFMIPHFEVSLLLTIS